MVQDLNLCEKCGYSVPISENTCPHCAWPGRYPNVIMTQSEDEREALEARYQSALEQARMEGVIDAVISFETAVKEQSKAVINRPFSAVSEWLKSDVQPYSTYYMLVNAKVRFPDNPKWDRWRNMTDRLVFLSPTVFEQIRFAALTLDGKGIDHYGECSFVFKSAMIEHRATVFEENSVVFCKDRKIDPWSEEDNLIPKGYRTVWQDRHKLAVAKLASQITANTQNKDFADVLLHNGEDSLKDRFIEVHIFGSITQKTIESVRVKSAKRGSQKQLLKNLRQKLEILIEEYS